MTWLAVPLRAGAEDGDPKLDAIGDVTDLNLEDLLNPLVVSATRLAIPEDEAPAITTVVTRAQIQKWGYRSVAEVLQHIAGFYIVDDHILPNASIRGISGGLRAESGILKVMVDGHPTAFRSTDGNWLGPELIPLSAVERVEIIRGPASALYGADAFLGVVNVITRSSQSLEGVEADLNLNYSGHKFGTGADVAVARTLGKWDFLVAGRTHNEDHSGLRLPASSPAPNIPAYASPDRTTHGLTQDSSVGFFRAGYNFAEGSRLTLSVYASRIDRGAEFADWTQLANGLDRDGRQNYNEISLQHGFAALNVTVKVLPTLDVGLDVTGFIGGPTSRDHIDVGSDVYYIRRNFDYRGMDLEAQSNWLPVSSLSVQAGIGLIVDHETLPWTEKVLKTSLGTAAAGDIQPDAPYQGTFDFYNPGARLQAVWVPFEHLLSVTGGLRYDYHNVYGSHPSARLGAVVSASDDLHFKLLYGSAFKAPSPALLYGQRLTQGDIAGSKTLRPSFVHSVDLQAVYTPTRYLLLATGPAYSYLRDQAEFTQQGVVARNLSRVSSLSWESQAVLNYRGSTEAYLNVSYNHTVRRSDDIGYEADLVGAENVIFPKVIANAGVVGEIPFLPLRLAVEGSYAGSRRASAINILQNGASYSLEPYFLLGGNLSTVGLQLLPERDSTLSIVVRNVLNGRIVDPGFSGVDYPQLPRTVMVKLVQEL